MANTIFTTDYKSPYGEIILGEFKGELCLADWKYRKMRAQIDSRILSGLDAIFETKKTIFLKQVIQQLEEYFEGNRQSFDVPLKFVGTDFQQQVWKALLEIPFGKTSSYLDLSKRLNNVKAIRAVASANGANAISILVPCHRIIGSSGELIGYAGGLPAKKRLLELENPHKELQLELF